MPSGNLPSGNITIGATGGNGEYLFSINNSEFNADNVFGDLVAGDYEIIVSDTNNCTSATFTASVEAFDVNNEVVQSIIEGLQAVFQEALSYQWINADTQEEILGATSVNFIPNAYGNYQVEMVVDISVTISSKNTSAKTFTETKTILSPIVSYNAGVLSSSTYTVDSFTVYPNPAFEYIQLPKQVLDEKYTIVDTSGRQLKAGIISDSKIYVSDLSDGIYFIVVNGYNSVKFIKK